ncbi:Cytoplasmic tRNA 2-thiolation protein 2, variant 2 [Chamberlinius hualienensis]
MCSRVAEGDDIDSESVVSCESIASGINSLDLEKSPVCKKCSQPAVIFISRSGSYCGSCLFTSVAHKFRACLGKSRILKRNERVLIAYSGGRMSTGMLNLVKHMLDEATFKRTIIQPTVVHIDESAILDDLDPEICEDNWRKVAACAKKCNFPTFLTRLESIFGDDDKSEMLVEVENPSQMNLVLNETLRSRMKSLINSVSSLTSKHDLVQKLRNDILTKIAMKLNCTKVFVGDCQDRLAVRLLSDIAIGNGQFLLKTIGLADDRFQDVSIIRPLREISAKEITFCVNFLNLETVFIPSLSTMQGKSIQSLTEKFVLGLQEYFPATVTTIFRTGDKLGSHTNQNQNQPNEKVETENLCILCSGLLSVNLNLSVTQLTNQNNHKCDEDGKCLTKPIRNLSVADVNKFCCYSCQVVNRDLSDTSSLPPYITDKVFQRINRYEFLQNMT